MIVVTALLILVPKWPSGPIERPRVFDKSYVSYYTPPKSFPALRSHPARPQANRQPVAARRPTIRVAPEHARRPGRAGRPEPGSDPATRSDFVEAWKAQASGFAYIRSHDAPLRYRELAPGCAGQPDLAGRSALDSGLPTARGAGPLQASAVAPAAEVAGVPSRRGAAISGLHSAVIGPPPSVAGSCAGSDTSISVNRRVVNPPAVADGRARLFREWPKGRWGD